MVSKHESWWPKQSKKENICSADSCCLPHPNGGIKKEKELFRWNSQTHQDCFWSWPGHCDILDRHDFSNQYYHQGINFIFQAEIPGTYPDNSVRMPRYDDVLGVPLVHLWHKTTQDLLASASEGVYTCSRAAINAPHMDVSASTWYNVSLQRQRRPPDFNTELQVFFSKKYVKFIYKPSCKVALLRKFYSRGI